MAIWKLRTAPWIKTILLTVLLNEHCCWKPRTIFCIVIAAMPSATIGESHGCMMSSFFFSAESFTKFARYGCARSCARSDARSFGIAVTREGGHRG